MPEPVSRRQPPFDVDDHRDVETEQAVRRLPRATMEDPLEELARILGETTGYPARPEPVADAGRRGEMTARPGPQQLSALEAELFDELRASVTPETRVRGEFEREITPPIPQHPVDDHDIASLRIGAGRADADAPRSAEGAAAQWSDFYAYDDGVAAGSYDPAFARAPSRAAPVDPDYAEPARSLRDEPAYPHATFDEFGRDEIAEAAREAAPLVAAEPRIMPHSRDEERAAARLPHEGGNSGMKIAAAAVALVLVGGGALAAWKYTGGGGGGGEPVLVRADGKPFKVVPEPGKPSAETGPTLTPDDPRAGSRIVSRQEDPVDQVSARTPEGKEVRLVNPGAPRATADVPHTVKTVVVRPDGSIVSDGVAVRPARTAPVAPETPPPVAPEAPPPTVPPAVTQKAPPAPPAPPAMPPMQGAAPVAPPPVETRPPAPKPPAAAVPASQTTTPIATRPPAPKPPVAVSPEPPPAATTPPAATVAAPKVKTVAVTPSTAARPGDGAPMSLGPVGPRLANQPPATQQAAPPPPARQAAPPPPAAPKPIASAPVAITPPPAAAGGSGDFMVQISASGSEGEARNSFAAAQRKYSALAGKSVDVQRADLGAKGVFWRARVPAGSREQAAALCQQLQSQGGQCMVVRR
ncbi:MAG: SPOR domain-containing protein [Siculibacillus sp.]|nr:SPOR domain-containing protein [Siculibacillus sp.]